MDKYGEKKGKEKNLQNEAIGVISKEHVCLVLFLLSWIQNAHVC